MPESEDLLALLNICEIESSNTPVLFSVLGSPDKFYRSFKIPKRNGGFRVIDSPYPSLEIIQRSILRNVLSNFPAHPNAYAFIKGRNAITHASHHLACRELITLDIKDFFPSITRQMVIDALIENGLANGVANYISLLCCLNGTLPQGACTSPALSNLVFERIDERLSRLAKTLKLKYSRYADDLAFSGDAIPRDMPQLIERILESRDLKLNKEKIRLKIAGAKKIITGVSISSGTLKAPREFKRLLRTQIYELEKNIDDISQMRSFDPLVYERVLGRLNYLLQIEPKNAFALQKKASLSQHHQRFLALSSGQWPALFPDADLAA
ncbi:reverse transcriptase family protein [Cupriavidus necator]|uniref:RNA-directed DNA polymerase n=1 Tax=Cupriavidus pinatubonensis (strain JMP 134 / LMG 1197) TaxID=264198 RepID=Q477P7_CUPPJ|nr:reverse transcriptase family protein [Cupriavidus necator]